MKILGALGILSVCWYTINIARVEWGRGNKGGAMAVWLLALIALGLPLYTLLFAV